MVDEKGCRTCKHVSKPIHEYPCWDCMPGFPSLPNWEPSKPPLGVMPYKLWLEDRVVKLCEALIRSANHGTINDWSVERVEELKMHIHKLRERNR